MKHKFKAGDKVKIQRRVRTLVHRTNRKGGWVINKQISGLYMWNETDMTPIIPSVSRGEQEALRKIAKEIDALHRSMTALRKKYLGKA